MAIHDLEVGPAAPAPDRLGLPAATTRIDPETGAVRSWWASAALDEPGAHVLLVGIDTSRVEVHEVADPRIDFVRLMDDDAVVTALARLTGEPADPARRADALAALGGGARASDWVRAVAGTGSAGLLDGTVLVVTSRVTPLGDASYQDNRIVHTVCPTVDATVLLRTCPTVANRLLALACAPHDARMVTALEAALATARPSGAGRLSEASAAGRTLRICRAAGGSAGPGVAQKNAYLHHARRRSVSS